MDYGLALMTGVDFYIKECNLIMHQPSIKEISYFGEVDFFQILQLLTLNKSMYENAETNMVIPDLSNFILFIQIINEESMKDVKAKTEEILKLLFPSYKIIITPRAILFNQNNNTFILNEENFENFQKILNIVFCLAESGQQAFNPEGRKAQEIAKKLEENRKRIAKIKASEKTGNSSTFGQYLSILTVGINSMSLFDAMNLTIYQMYDLVERYSLYIGWDLDIRSRLAGAKGEKPVENWMKSIH